MAVPSKGIPGLSGQDASTSQIDWSKFKSIMDMLDPGLEARRNAALGKTPPAPQEVQTPSYMPSNKRPKIPKDKPKATPKTPPPLGPASLSDQDRTAATESYGPETALPETDPLPPPRRFELSPDEELQAPERGARRDFSAEEAKLAEMAQSPQGFTQAFLDSYTRQFAPNIAAGRDRERDMRISLAEKALRAEQADADADFTAREQMKQQVYLSQLGQRMGKQHFTDTETGLSGYATPFDIMGADTEQQKLKLDEARTNAQVDYYGVLGQAAMQKPDLAQDTRQSLNDRAILAAANNPMSGISPQQVQEALARLSGGGGGMPPAGPQAAPLSPQAQQVQAIDPDIAQRWDAIMKSPANKTKFLKWLQTTQLPEEKKRQLGQLLNSK